jgi:hypothetical protein
MRVAVSVLMLFPPPCSEIHNSAKTQIRTIRSACKEIKECESWKKLLKLILLLGNALNASSNSRSYASGECLGTFSSTPVVLLILNLYIGVRLNSLLALSGTRSNDGGNVLGKKIIIHRNLCLLTAYHTL